LALCRYPGADTPAGRALDHLERRVAAGTVPLGIEGSRAEYPVYATALALLAFQRHRPGSPAVEPLRAWLAGAQLVAGWEGTPAYGGFPMGGVLRPVPPYPGHVDLSMTRRALQALGPDPAVSEPARRFLAACRRGDGAIYSPVAEPLNKGAPGPDGRSGPYGTPTADFVLASLAVGVPRADPGLATPLAWLHAHVTSEENPGVSGGPVAEYAPAMTLLWLASLAEVLAVAPTPAGDAADRVAGAVIARQGPDGLWKNTSGLQKEDDPIVATSLALVALAGSV
jgi:hypothetical protein